MTNAPMNLQDALAYAMAGNATLTVQNTKTGNRHTFKVRAADPRPNMAPTWFVSHLAGSDNEGDYRYLGFIRAGAYQPSAKAPQEWPSQKAAGWFFSHLLTQRPVPAGLEIYHENKCGRCGRKLTTPESIKMGLGPECATKAHS